MILMIFVITLLVKNTKKSQPFENEIRFKQSIFLLQKYIFAILWDIKLVNFIDFKNKQQTLIKIIFFHNFSEEKILYIF